MRGVATGLEGAAAADHLVRHRFQQLIQRHRVFPGQFDQKMRAQPGEAARVLEDWNQQRRKMEPQDAGLLVFLFHLRAEQRRYALVPFIPLGVPPLHNGPGQPPRRFPNPVGGMPAVRMADMITCAGPPDIIAMGAPKILIGGMPAARMGDMSAHGGAIALGHVTVLIG